MDPNSKQTNLEEIALFPIPELVSFPMSITPLHVFEPRYRSMIKDCVKNNIKIGVTHTQSVTSKKLKDQTREELLSSNQETYKPQNIFSAGLCEIKDVTADGRLYVEIKMSDRYKLEEEIQSLPYKIYSCSLYTDIQNKEEQPSSYNKEIEGMRALLEKFLIDFAVREKNRKLLDLLNSKEWENLNIKDYSFRIFGLVRFEGHYAQKALEARSSFERLKIACTLLQLTK